MRTCDGIDEVISGLGWTGPGKIQERHWDSDCDGLVGGAVVVLASAFDLFHPGVL